jgi:hypothetical protein
MKSANHNSQFYGPGRVANSFIVRLEAKGMSVFT